MPNLANVFVSLKLDKAQFQSDLKQASKSAQSFGKDLQNTGRKLTRNVTLPMAAAGAAAVKLATDAEETANKFDVVFGDAAARSRRELEGLTETIPLTITELERMASGVQDFLVPLGIARNEAADMSTQIVELAGDLASFNNVSADIPLEAIQSGLAGMSRPLRQFGVDISQARLESLALAEGLIQAGEEMDNTARAQAIFSAIQQDSADAMGDAARTAESTANMFRFFKRDVKALVESIGRDLIPAARDMVSGARSLITAFSGLSDETRGLVVQIGLVVAGIGPLLATLGTLLTFVTPAGALLAGLGIFAGLLVTIDQHSKQLSDSTKEYVSSLEELSAATVDQARVQRAALAGRLANIEAMIRERQATLENVKAKILEAEAGGRLGLGMDAESIEELRELTSELRDLQAESEATKDRIVEFEQQIRTMAEVTAGGAEGVQQVGDAAEESASDVDTLSDSLSGIDQEFRAIEARARIFGESFNTTAAKAEVLKREIVSLIRQGFDPQGVVLQGLIEDYEELNDQLIPHTELVAETGDEYKTLIQDSAEAADANKELASEIQSTGQEILAVTSFALNLAESFGLMGEEAGKAGKALQGAIGGAGLGAKVGGPIGAVVGGVLGGLGSLLGGGGPSEAERINQDLQVTLKLLSQDIDKLRSVVQALSREQVGDLVAFMREMERRARDAGKGVEEFVRSLNTLAGLEELMAEFGVSLLDVRDAAKKFGIDVDALIKLVETGSGDLDVAREQLIAFLKAVGLLPDAFDAASRAIIELTESMSRAQRDIQRFDVDSAKEQFEILLRGLINAIPTGEGTAPQLGGGSGPALLPGGDIVRSDPSGPLNELINVLVNADIGKAAVRQSVIEEINSFINKLRASGQLIEGVDELELERQLIDMIELIRSIGEDAAAGGVGVGGGATSPADREVGPATDFVERSVITEIQGSELIAIQRSALVRLEQMLAKDDRRDLLIAELPTGIRDGIDLALSDDLEMQT